MIPYEYGGMVYMFRCRAWCGTPCLNHIGVERKVYPPYDVYYSFGIIEAFVLVTTLVKTVTHRHSMQDGTPLHCELGQI